MQFHDKITGEIRDEQGMIQHYKDNVASIIDNINPNGGKFIAFLLKLGTSQGSTCSSQLFPITQLTEIRGIQIGRKEFICRCYNYLCNRPNNSP